jgi:hypothetical protein
VLYAGRLVLGPTRGLRADYFAGEDRLAPAVISGVDSEITTDQLLTRWYAAPPGAFRVRWFGYVTVLNRGRYTFALTSDDGSALSVDGKPVIENGGRHEARTVTGEVALDRGAHAILVEYTQEGGTFAVDWQWAREGGRLERVPSWQLSPTRSGPAVIVAARAADWLAAGLLAAALALLGLMAWRGRQGLEARMRWVALGIFVVLSIVHTWPLATDPAHLTRHDNRDTMLNEWIVAWVAHQAVANPLRLFDGNIFHPEPRTLAYSEPMIPQAALGAPFLWAGASPPLVYNLLVLAGLALSGWSMCVVLYSWTGCWTAGLVGGAIFAFNAHVLTRVPHLQAQHVEFLPLVLWALDRLLMSPGIGRAVHLASWFVLQSLASIHLLVFSTFAMAGAVLARPEDWWGRRFVPALKGLAVAGVLSGILLLPFLLPYYRVNQDQGLTRSLEDAAMYAGTWKDYLSTPSRLHYPLWSHRFFAGTALFPGALGILLTLVAIARGGLREPRMRMCLAVGVVGVVMSFGPTLPGYATLFEALPLLRAIRGTARFGYLATAAVAAAAGLGVLALKRMTAARHWPAIAGLLVAIASVESLAAPLGFVRFHGIPPIYARVPREPGIHVVEIPFHGPRSSSFHASYMLNSTRHWRPIMNGYSGFQPPSFFQHAAILQSFPSDASIDLLRSLAVTHVFVHTAQLPSETLGEIEERPELELVETFGAIRLYRRTS